MALATSENIGVSWIDNRKTRATTGRRLRRQTTARPENAVKRASHARDCRTWQTALVACSGCPVRFGDLLSINAIDWRAERGDCALIHRAVTLMPLCKRTSGCIIPHLIWSNR